jgi:hypothetical protein
MQERIYKGDAAKVRLTGDGVLADAVAFALLEPSSPNVRHFHIKSAATRRAREHIRTN